MPKGVLIRGGVSGCASANPLDRAANDRFRWVHILVANVPTMVLTAAQRAALTQILDTASDLNRWRLRAHRVEEPQRGSELGVDDL